MAWWVDSGKPGLFLTRCAHPDNITGEFIVTPNFFVILNAVKDLIFN
jgi:hypothetical protein